MWGLLPDQSPVSAGGDSSQDEAEEEAKAITVKKKQNNSHRNKIYDKRWLWDDLDSPFLNVSVTLQVRFARPESEQARQRRIQSYEFLQKKQAEEPWVHLHYHGVKVRSLE